MISYVEFRKLICFHTCSSQDLNMNKNNQWVFTTSKSKITETKAYKNLLYYLVRIAGSDDPHTLGVALILDGEIRWCKCPRRPLQIRPTCFHCKRTKSQKWRHLQNTIRHKSSRLSKCLKSYHTTLSGMPLIIPEDIVCCLTVSPNTQIGSWRNIFSDWKNKELRKRYYSPKRALNRVSPVCDYKEGGENP